MSEDKPDLDRTDKRLSQAIDTFKRVRTDTKLSVPPKKDKTGEVRCP